MVRPDVEDADSLPPVRREFASKKVTRLLLFTLLTAFGLAVPSMAAAQGGEAIAGTFRNPEADNEPVPGVEVVVTAEDGTRVGVAISDDDGRYELELPGEGRYTAELQVDTLPEGVRLTDPDRTTLTFQVNPGQRKALIFPFGEDTAASVTFVDRLLPTLLDGARLGLIIAMCAIGLSLIYGTTQFTNFAHGEMVMFGALVTWFFNQLGGLPVIVAAAIAVVAAGAFGAVQEVALWGPLRRRKTGPFSMMTISFGLSLFLVYLFQYLYGSRSRPYSQYVIQDPLFSLGNANVPPRVIATIVLSVVVLGAVGLFLQRARFGKATRAVADNGPLAAASGINSDRVILLVWIMGSALAGLGGILNSLDQQVQFQQGSNLLLLMFAGITLGGLGTSFGAAAGCFLIGIAIQVSTLFVPTSLKNVGALVILILVLLFRPQGIFGRKERVG
jgi:branched-chain amino acid transport system permease protein